MEKYYKRVFAKPKEYNGIEFRSTMERDFAMFLDGQFVRYKTNRLYYHRPVKWEYESKEFELIPQEQWFDRTEKDTTLKKLVRNKNHTLQRVIYTPDFYLPDYDLYIEIKGKQFDDDLFRLRLRVFRHFYPDKAVWVVRHHDDFMKLDEVLENIKIGGTNNVRETNDSQSKGKWE